MGNNKHISKPPLKEFTVLCIDGTDCHDSISFSRLMNWAGHRNGFLVRNLLSYLPPLEKGKEKEPRKSSGIISFPVSGSRPTGFPFSPDKLPMKFVSRPLAYKRLKAGRRSDYVLLPQGEVKGKINDFGDSLLGSNAASRVRAAMDNSKFLEYFALAPGIIDAGSSSAHPGFVTAGNKNKSVDFLYLSGHGGMSGNIVGEAPRYLKYFSVQNIAKKEFLEIGQASLISPLWIVLSSCFSLRKIHCQFWARYFQKQQIPIRGILGYRRTSPLAAHTVAINERFARNLRQGKTFLESWKLAHERSGLRDRWTALAFDFSKDDTLESLYKFKQKRTRPSSKDNLFFYDIDSFGMEGGRIKEGEKIEVLPSEVLMEIHHWEKVGIWSWKKFLITNIDFTKSTFDAYVRSKTTTKLVNNDSWDHCHGVKRMIDFNNNIWSFYPFSPNEIYQISLYPPFKGHFKSGFKINDKIYFTLVHVRRDYSKLFNFSDIFDVLLINGQQAIKDGNFSLVKGADNKKEDTIRIKATTNNTFLPVKFAVRFKKRDSLLWFWFGITIQRGGTEIFKSDIDSFTVKYEDSDDFIAFNRRTSGDPLPTQ